MTYGDNNILTRMFALLGRSRFTPKRLAKVEGVNPADAGVKRNPVIKTASMPKKAGLISAVGRGSSNFMKNQLTNPGLLIPASIGLAMGGPKGAIEMATDEVKVGPGTIGQYKQIKDNRTFRNKTPKLNTLEKIKDQNKNIPNL
jgi:hypothetical protein